MPCIPLHQTWQIYPLQLSIDALHTVTPNLPDLPPTIKHRCLAYHYTKFGRSTPDLLADLPPTIKHRCLAYYYPILGRSTADLLADLSPTIKHRCLAYHYTKFGRSNPLQSSIDALHKVTPNLPDLLPSSIDALHTITPNLADLPPTIKH